MGRNPGDAEFVTVPPVLETARLWETIRRKLGRLFAHPIVHRLPPEAFAPLVSQRSWRFETLVAVGEQEANWRPQAALLACPIPQATAPPQDPDLAAFASTISGNIALRPESSGILSAVLPPALCRVDALERKQWLVPLANIASEPMALAGGDARSQSPGVIQTPKLAQITATALRPARPRLGLATGVMVAHVPLRRERRPIPPLTADVEAFGLERQRLSTASGVPLDDLMLIGVFPRVPVTAISRIALEGDGLLSVWLKPELLGSPTTLKWRTVVLGRQRSTGKMLQTIL